MLNLNFLPALLSSPANHPLTICALKFGRLSALSPKTDTNLIHLVFQGQKPVPTVREAHVRRREDDHHDDEDNDDDAEENDEIEESHLLTTR